MSCSCEGLEFNGAWVGTHLKYKVEITAQDFSMDDDEFEIEVRRGKDSLIFHKEDLLIHETWETIPGGQIIVNEYYVLIDTSALGPGRYDVITKAYVPDNDVEGGVRLEVDKQTLVVVNSL